MNLKRIFIYSEDISEPLDEGIKKAAFQIINALSNIANIFVVYKKGNIVKDNFVKIESNRLLINFKLKKVIREFNPDIILYIPRWCGTFASFIRMQVLHSYFRKSYSIMVILQPKRLNIFHKKIIRFFKANKVYTPSPEVMKLMKKCKITVEFLPLTVDRKRFKPLNDMYKKNKLREKYGLPKEKYIILHVGHINYGRNLEALVPLQNNNNQVLIVSSSSTSEVAFKEASLKNSLEGKGLIVIDTYVENIEEIYQLSDIYVFPVIYERGCISLPLSVLEARACGLPIVTTDFGGLRQVFENEEREFIYSDPSDFLSKINLMKSEYHVKIDNDDICKIDMMFRESVTRMIKI